MRTRHRQTKREKVCVLEMRLSYYQLQDLVLRVRDVKSTNSTWTDFVELLEAAFEDADEPS